VLVLVEVVDGIARVAEGSGVAVEGEAGGMKEVVEGGGWERDVIVRFNALSQVCSNSFILVRTNNAVHGVVTHRLVPLALRYTLPGSVISNRGSSCNPPIGFHYRRCKSMHHKGKSNCGRELVGIVCTPGSFLPVAHCPRLCNFLYTVVRLI